MYADKDAELIEAFNLTSRYLDDLLNIDNTYQNFNSIKQIHPFLDLHWTISDGFVSSKIDGKRDDFDFHIVNVPVLDGDIPRATSYGVY